MKLLNDGPLTDAEIEELDQFLLETVGIDAAMDLSTLDGLPDGDPVRSQDHPAQRMAALGVGHGARRRRPGVQGPGPGAAHLGLLMRHMNDIAETPHQAPEHYEPLLMENPNNGDPIRILDEWCGGFMKGVQLDAEGWRPVVVGKPDWLSTVMLYGTEVGWDVLEKKKLLLDEHKTLANGLADSVRKIHA